MDIEVATLSPNIANLAHFFYLLSTACRLSKLSVNEAKTSPGLRGSKMLDLRTSGN